MTDRAASIFSLDQVRREPSFLAFLLQQLGVPFAGFLGTMLTARAPQLFWGWTASEATRNALELVWCYLLSAAVGACLGLFMAWRFQHAASTGKWIWIIPGALCLLVILFGGLSSSLVESLRMVLFPRADDMAWLIFLLLICPSLTTVFYSGTFWRASKAR